MLFRSLFFLSGVLASFACQSTSCNDMPTALATMRSVDQYVRERLTAQESVDEQAAAMLGLVDRQNTKQLAELLAACGWPLVRDGNWQASDDAWILAQHADHDRKFQHRALKLLEQAVKAGHARGGHLAYLSDRLALAEGRPQLYGTQFKLEGCKLEAYEKEAREHLLPPGCLAAPPAP